MAARLDVLGRDFDRRLVEQRAEPTLARASRHVAAPTDLRSRVILDANRAYDLLLLGRAREAAALLQPSLDLLRANPRLMDQQFQWVVQAYLAVAYLRQGEQDNCVHHHQAASCLFPIQGSGVHSEQEGSRLARREYAHILEHDPADLTARWLLNVSAMTLGDYPAGLPPDALIPASAFASDGPMGRFTEDASGRGLVAPGLTGGSVLEDFDGDGDADLMASSYGLDGERDQLRYFRNDGDGRFSDRTAEAGLLGLRGGANMVQADYDNDGDVDVFVARGGAVLGRLGEQPPSLLRNDGQGHFVDRTRAAGLYFEHPSSAAAWGDYDNDGRLDLFVGLESSQVPYYDLPLFRPFQPSVQRPCRLYHNDGNGTFTEVGHAAGLDVKGFVKGAVWGDYDNDGRIDLLVTQAYGATRLYHNLGPAPRTPRGGGGWRFEEAEALEPRRGQVAWWWDYDNDGWLDLFVSGYVPERSGTAAGQVAASYLGQPVTTERARLYHNDHGRLVDASAESHLNRILYGVGGNYGDLDNDGWPDLFVSTGASDFRALMPDRMFRNAEGHFFQDVTTAAGVGHLQKGGAVSFGDIDGDGDQDVYVVKGGEYPGDGFLDALFVNPGTDNHWVTLRLVGARANRSAIGARVTVRTRGDSGPRAVEALVGSGGSFGASTLQQELGLGRATAVEAVIVRWPGGAAETFTGVKLDAVTVLREGAGRP